jgi:hypothetical protein
MIGAIHKVIDDSIRHVSSCAEIAQMILGLEHLGACHSEVALEFPVREAAESFANQARRGTGRIPQLIAEFDILPEDVVGTKCDHLVSHFRRKLPGIEIFELLHAHGEAPSTTCAVV